jgi:hypothetical protein
MNKCYLKKSSSDNNLKNGGSKSGVSTSLIIGADRGDIPCLSLRPLDEVEN